MCPGRRWCGRADLRGSGERRAGKNGVGKSSTANSLLNESAFVVSPFQQDQGKPVTVVKRRDGFTLRIIDTPGLAEGDQISERVRRRILRYLLKRIYVQIFFIAVFQLSVSGLLGVWLPQLLWGSAAAAMHRPAGAAAAAPKWRMCQRADAKLATFSLDGRQGKIAGGNSHCPAAADALTRGAPQALLLIQNEAARASVDVVLYLDRLDLYRVEPIDHEALPLPPPPSPWA